MSKREHHLLLQDMKEASEKILRYVDGITFEDFQNDEKTVDAVIRNFEIIGEAANRINEPYRKSNEKVHWNRLRGFRNRIVHEYFGVDLEIVWSIIENDLDELIRQLNQLLGN